MTNGRRWLALDADMFGKRFTHDLHQRFGPAGVAVWVAFLCACKQSQTPGRIRIANDYDAMTKLGIVGWDLRDDKGEPWTLSEFFDFTGRKKQTRRVAVQLLNSRRIADQRLLDVCATHWERWQNDRRTDAERLRKRRWWAENRSAGASSDCASDALGRVALDAPDIDKDKDISPYPTQGAPPPAPPGTNLRANGTNPRARGTNLRARQQEAERTPIPEWPGEELPDRGVPPGSAENLRASMPPPPPPKKDLL